MKVNLTFNSRERLPGYITIDPFYDPAGHEGVIVGDIYNFDKHVLDGEAEEIRAIDILSYFSPKLVDDIFAYWLKKLAFGGTIVIGGVEPYLLAKQLVTRAISVPDLNDILFGLQRFPWEYRKSVVDLQTLSAAFVQKGLVITHKDIDGYKFIIKAKKVLNPGDLEDGV